MFERRKDNRFGMGIILLAYQVFARFQGLAGIPPVTFAALVLQAGMFLKVIVPHSYGDPKAYCLQGEAILGRGELHRLFWAHLEHGSDMHLYYNMLSLIWKGKILEPYYGSVPFAGLLLFFMGTTGVLYAGLADLASEVGRAAF